MPADQGVEEVSKNQIRIQMHRPLQKPDLEEVETPSQDHEVDEQFRTQKAKQMRLTDPAEEEMPSLKPMAQGVVEMWERKAPGRKESGQLKMIA